MHTALRILCIQLEWRKSVFPQTCCLIAGHQECVRPVLGLSATPALWRCPGDWLAQGDREPAVVRNTEAAWDCEGQDLQGQGWISDQRTSRSWWEFSMTVTKDAADLPSDISSEPHSHNCCIFIGSSSLSGSSSVVCWPLELALQGIQSRMWLLTSSTVHRLLRRGGSSRLLLMPSPPPASAPSHRLQVIEIRHPCIKSNNTTKVLHGWRLDVTDDGLELLLQETAECIAYLCCWSLRIWWWYDLQKSGGLACNSRRAPSAQSSMRRRSRSTSPTPSRSRRTWELMSWSMESLSAQTCKFPTSHILLKLTSTRVEATFGKQ